MKLIIAIIVFNRIENIEKWLLCWQQCEQHGAELIIIHNTSNIADINHLQSICGNIKVISRKNIGLDVGAFQDVCKERLKGFPNDWTHLLWFTDDVFPISKDFIKPFIDALEDHAVACMDISSEVKIHIRTSCFAIKKEISRKLSFIADPITTKIQCYQFEHAHKKAFYEQVIEMGECVKQVAVKKNSPVWDSNYRQRLDRQKEFDQLFNIKTMAKKVCFICPIFDCYPQIISSLVCQTHNEWELLLIHDGANDLNSFITDERIKYIKRPRMANYGHPHRQWALQEIKANNLANDSDYIVITNADNYYMPTFIEKMLGGFINGEVAAYCEQMVHNYQQWNVMQCELRLGHIDCGAMMVKKDIATQVGWRDTKSHSSDWTYFSDILQKYKNDKFAKVKGCLFVHN